MPILYNARHERFALEVASGLPISAAYIEAGYNENRGNACRLKANENVNSRIAEIQAEKAKRVSLTRDDLLRMMLDDRELARREAQSSAAIRASELLGRELAGLYVEKREYGGPGSFEKLTDSELLAFAHSEASALADLRAGNVEENVEDAVILEGDE